MAVPQKVADQAAVVGHLARAFAITDASSLNDGLVVTHHINERDETVVEDGEFFPTEGFDKSSVGWHPVAGEIKVKPVLVGDLPMDQRWRRNLRKMTVAVTPQRANSTVEGSGTMRKVALAR